MSFFQKKTYDPSRDIENLKTIISTIDSISESGQKDIQNRLDSLGNYVEFSKRVQADLEKETAVSESYKDLLETFNTNLLDRINK